MSIRNHLCAAQLMVGIVCVAPCFSQGQVKGAWTDVPTTWPVFAIHVAQLPNGSLLLMNRHRDATANQPEILFKPYLASGPDFASTTLVANNATELFCSGFVPLQNGTLMVAGGHNQHEGYGRQDIWIFDPTGNTWTRQSDMSLGRWYPSCVFLPNSRVMVFSGSIDGFPNHQNCDRPTIWLGGCDLGTESDDAIFNFPFWMAHSLDLYYPQLFIDPLDGNLFFTGKGCPGDGQEYLGNQKLDLASLEWTKEYLPLPEGVQNVQWEYPSAVMVNGIIVKSGGSKQDNNLARDCSNRSLWIDMNGSRTWHQGPNMNLARKNHNLVALPDGRVAAFGGNQRGQVLDAEQCMAPEVWNPAVPEKGWQLWSAPGVGTRSLTRAYHSTAMLLPDARVLVSGGEPEGDGAYRGSNKSLVYPRRRAQIFSPPYGNVDGWQAVRPVIVTSPQSMGYRESATLDVTTTGNRPIRRMTMISLGATTHGFNQRQNVVFLPFRQSGSTLTVSTPEATKIAPPGYYMLFAVDELGIPSVAKIIQLKDMEILFPDNIELTRATSEHPWEKRELILGDNEYLGGRISSQDSEIEMIISKNLSEEFEDSKKIRLNLEMKTSAAPVTLRVLLYNWTTACYEKVDGTELCSTREQTFSFESPDLAPSPDFPEETSARNPYIELRSRAIRAKVQISRSSNFDVSIDVIELGVR